MITNRQVFLVTGASSGGGRSIVEHFTGRKKILLMLRLAAQMH